MRGRLPRVARLALGLVGAVILAAISFLAISIVLLMVSPWPCEEVNCGSGPNPPVWLSVGLYALGLGGLALYGVACVRWIRRH